MYRNEIYLESKIEDYKFIENLKCILDLNIFYEHINLYLKKNYEVDKINIKVKYKKIKEILFRNYYKEEKNLNIKIYIKVHKDTYLIFSIVAKDLKHLLLLNNNENSLKIFFHNISQILFTIYLENKIENLKLKDSLTSLYNREYLSLYLSKMLPLSKRENKKIAFLLLGIDHFKAVVDEFTYDVGDELLLSLSRLLVYQLRTSDLIIKLDKDEFLLVLPNIINKNNAMIIACKLIKSFAESKISINSKNKQFLQKTISIGISLYPDDSNTIDEILRHADVSLYEAKNIGRSSFFTYSKETTNSFDLF